MDKRALSERDICTKFITPAVKAAGWDELTQIREEVSFTKGRIVVRGKLVSRGKGKRADYILYYKPNIPLALIEAKDNKQSVGGGIQQGLEYAAALDIPFVFSSNGDGFVFHDRTGKSPSRERTIGLDAFPSPEDLWQRYASIGTNLLFFEKGEPTRDIWFYEHQVPEGQKAYSMTRPIRFEHFANCIDWWGGAERKGREEGPQAWKVGFRTSLLA